MFLQDIRYAVRSLVLDRGVTIIVILCLALGIGINATLFAVIDGVLIQSLPFAEADCLVVLQETFERVSLVACYNICGYNRLMVVELKLRKIGNSVGVVLPKEALARLNASEGDVLFLTDGADGSFRLTASDPTFADKMAKAEGISRRYRNALRELAK